MGNTIFIVWRESVEAMLVIGILYAWLVSHADARAGLRFLWGGVAAGIGMALLLAVFMLKAQSEMAGAALDYFQITMMLVASALITQMVFWMRKHGRSLKRNMEAGMERAMERGNWWGMAVVAAIAVGREGAEMVIFLYGSAQAAHGMAQFRFYMACAAGLGLALLTFWLLSRGGRYCSWKVFFRFSEVVLLFLAAALLVDGADRIIGLGLLPPLVDPVWDTSWLLDDSSTAGNLVAALTGYRARPALLVLLAYGIYWVLVLILMRTTRQPSANSAREHPGHE